MIKYNSNMEELANKINELQEHINEMANNQRSLVIAMDVLIGVLESNKIITKKQMQRKFQKMRDASRVPNKKDGKESYQHYLNWLIEECKTHGNA